MVIIERQDYVKRINETNKWILIYGRRKTGKTFLVNNFIKFDEYFFVKSDKSILYRNSEQISYETFINIFKKLADSGGTIVVDEFHRLGTDFFDFLHSLNKKGKVILISSTLFLSKKLISANSALLGIFSEIQVRLIALDDCLKAAEKLGFANKEWLETAILIREPIAIDYLDKSKKAREIITSVLAGSQRAIPAMVGEIFSEEEKNISAVYEGILRAIAAGREGSGEISSYLFSKKLIKKDDPSIVQQYAANLISFGIIKRIEVFNKKRFIYKLYSPLSKLYYYADEKYNLSERKAGEAELLAITDEMMPRIVEDNVREFLSEKLGLRESIIQDKDFDVDICLLKFKKIDIAIEVKWGNVSKADILKSEETLGKVDARKRFIFVQDKKKINSKIKVIDVHDLLQINRQV